MSVRDQVREAWVERFKVQSGREAKEDGGESHPDTITHVEVSRGEITRPDHKTESPSESIVIISSEEETDDPDIYENETDEDEHFNRSDELKEVEVLTDSSDSKSEIIKTEGQSAEFVEIIEEIENEAQIEELGDDFEEVGETVRLHPPRGMSASTGGNDFESLKAVEVISDGIDLQLPGRKKRKKFEYIELSDDNDEQTFSRKNKPFPPFKPFHNPLYDKPPLQSAITIHDILSSPNIDSSYLFTYYIELREFLSYYRSPSTNINIIIQSGHILDTERISEKFTNLNIMKVNMKPYTSHHCKIIINKYKNGEWKIFLISCNLMRAELVMNNQISWESPLLSRLERGDKDDSRFKYSFIKFLKGYRPFLGTKLNSLVKELEIVNFNPIVGDFIASVPLKTKFDDSKEHAFGFKGLVNVLKINDLLKPTNVDILYQSSSIASPINFDKKLNKVSNIFTHLILPFITSRIPFKLPSGTDSLKEYLLRNNITLRIVYPTFYNIHLSKFGAGSGTWSCFNGYGNPKSLAQLGLLKPFFYKPFSTQREFNTSHSKFIIASSDGFETLDWCLFTTCNISKQAWGNLLKTEGNNYTIDNFESGVFISKNHYKGYKLIPREIGEDERIGHKSLAEDEIAVVLPFDIKNTAKYEDEDKPWCIQGYGEN